MSQNWLIRNRGCRILCGLYFFYRYRKNTRRDTPIKKSTEEREKNSYRIIDVFCPFCFVAAVLRLLLFGVASISFLSATHSHTRNRRAAASWRTHNTRACVGDCSPILDVSSVVARTYILCYCT